MRFVAAAVVALAACASAPSPRPSPPVGEREQSRGTPTPDPRAALRSLLQARLPALQACYDAALARAPLLTGRLLLTLDLDARGVVTGVRAEGPLAEPALAGCLEAALRGAATGLATGEPLGVEVPLLLEPAPSSAGGGQPR